MSIDQGDAAKTWYERKSAMMESMLGPEHDMVLHAIIPFAIGGALDLYYYLKGVPGTGIATKELCELPTQGPSNRELDRYELVMFTRHALNSEKAKRPFASAQNVISHILNPLALYAADATLNPRDTTEFPRGMKVVGGRCMILDTYGSRPDPDAGNFGLMLVMEIYRSELKFAKKASGAELIARLKDKGHYPYSDMDRRPVA